MTSPLTCHPGIAKARGCSHIAVGTFSHLFPDLAPLPLTEAGAAAQFVDQDVTLDVSIALGPASGSAQATDVKGFVNKALGDVFSWS